MQSRALARITGDEPRRMIQIGSVGRRPVRGGGCGGDSDFSRDVDIEPRCEGGHRRVEAGEEFQELIRWVLEPRSRAIVEMYFRDGLNLQEIGDRLGMGMRSALGLIKQAMAVIRARAIDRMPRHERMSSNAPHRRALPAQPLAFMRTRQRRDKLPKRFIHE